MAFGLVDGDGNLDAVFANVGEPNRVCLGDGGGGFTCSDVSTDTNISTGVAFGLVDGDGNLDVVFANSSEPNRVCLGDGGAGFTCSDVSGDTNFTRAVALAAAATPPPAPVGGDLRPIDPAGLPLETPDSSGPSAGVFAGVAGLAAAAITLSGAAWYARRRWSR